MVSIPQIAKIKLLMFLSILPSFSAIGEVYKWKDANGVTHYSETKPENTDVVEFTFNTYKDVSIEDAPEAFVFKPIERNPKLTRTFPKPVIMYSAEWCGVCKKAKKHFKQKRIQYTEYDVDKSKSAKARFKKLGGKGVPIILVGKKRMNGFSVAGFNRIYH